MDYKGLKDRHLNVFCGYDSEHLENNITKALINTIDSYSEKEKREFYNSFFGTEIPKGKLKTELYLQQRPKESLIKSVPIKNRHIIGISPTGETWGFKSQDIQDEKVLKEEIIKDYLKRHPETQDDELENIAKYTINNIKERRTNRGSQPDAWIFVFVDNCPMYLYIIENKLYDLDPDQINNHIEKSLYQTEEKNSVIYYTFKKMVEFIGKIDSYMSEQFIEYMIILGYIEIDSFPLACAADTKIRKSLAYNVGEKIMKSIFKGDIDRRGANMIRKHLSKDGWLREINLGFGEEKIYISLALGPTMKSAREMYSTIDLPKEFMDKHICGPWSSFHLQYNRGRNIWKSYGEWEYEKYIDYWKNNVNELKLKTTNEAAEYLDTLYNAGFTPKMDKEELKNYLISRKNPINTIPEIIYEIQWSYEEVGEMNNNEEFIISFKNALNEFLDKISFKIEE